MIEEKRDLILSEGVPVTVSSIASATTFNTTALIGRATKQFDSTVSLETNRRAQFIPDDLIGNGFYVHNLVTNEDYLIIAVLREVVSGKIAANICHMYISNAKINVSKLEETADDNGNITNAPVVKCSNVPVYIQSLTAALKEYDLGLHPDAQFRIFTPLIDVTLLDSITVVTNGNTSPIKIVGTDFISYDGVVVLQARTETRG